MSERAWNLELVGLNFRCRHSFIRLREAFYSPQSSVSFSIKMERVTPNCTVLVKD